MYLIDHSIFLQDMKYMMSNLLKVDNNQSHKGFELEYLPDNNDLTHKYKMLVRFHPPLPGNSTLDHNCQFLELQEQQFNNTNLHHK